MISAAFDNNYGSKMTRKNKSSNLHEKLLLYIKSTFSDMSRLYKAHEAGENIFNKPWGIFVYKETDKLLTEIGRDLNGSTAFRDLSDLAQFLSDNLMAVLVATTDLKKLDLSLLATQLVDRLKNPLQSFSFDVSLSPHSDLSFSLEIGGERALKIVSVDRGTPNEMVLSGQVVAATEPSAIVAVEELIASLLGVCLVLDMCVVVTPLPGSRNSAFATITPHDPTIPSELSADVSAGIAGTVFRWPTDLTDLQRKRIRSGQLVKGLEPELRQLSGVMASTDDHAVTLRRAAALLLKASVTREIELAITYSFMCLEGVLLEPHATDNVLGRLREAVAYRIGTSARHRAALRKELKDLYDIRSRYVHTGRPGDSALSDVRRRCLTIVLEVLRREMQDLRM